VARSSGPFEPPAADRQPSLRLAASEYRVNISPKDPDVRLFCVQVQGFPDRGCAIGAGELGVMEVSSASRSPPHSGQLYVSLIVRSLLDSAGNTTCGPLLKRILVGMSLYAFARKIGGCGVGALVRPGLIAIRGTAGYTAGWGYPSPPSERAAWPTAFCSSRTRSPSEVSLPAHSV
jgi:hypothetical protein